jgi:LPS sulfotransferase NodH
LLEIICKRLAGRSHSPFFGEVAGLAPAKRYLIATTGRTGSTLLCSRIAEYGALGFPNEFLNESYISEFERLFPNPSLSDFERYISRAFTSKKSGVFGLKTDWWRFRLARELEVLRGFYEPLDLIVWLKREDFVAQAVSLVLANETQIWHVRGEEGGELAARHEQVEFDGSKIIAHARNILNQEYYWNCFFQTSEAPRVTLTYEELERDVDEGVQAIARAFDLSFALRRTEPGLKKGRSGVAQAWRERFEDEYADFVSFWREHRGLITASS